MPERCFVDTNILIYAHDRTAGTKHTLARELIERLWESGHGIVSTQVLQELCVNLRRKLPSPLSTDQVRLLIQDYLRWTVVVNTPVSVLQALELEERYKVSFWDALILQAAEASGADVLYSEDMATGQGYGALQVINPLL